jgi:monoamine oxidase
LKKKKKFMRSRDENLSAIHRRPLLPVGLAGLYNGCKVPSGKSAQPVIAIIGGGIAGLHAAYVLKNAGITAQVYEGSPRTGGRIMSVTGMMGEGLWTEMGGEFIDSDHKDMLDLAFHFNLPLLDRHVPSETNLKEFAYFFEGKHYELADVLKALHPYSEQIKNDIDSLSDDITFEKHSENDVRLDNLSIADYLEQLGMKGWFRDFITASYLAEYGMEIEEQSSINFLSIFDPGDDQEYKIYGTSDERYSVVGGNSRICDALSAALGTQVLKEHLLTAISQNEDKSYQSPSALQEPARSKPLQMSYYLLYLSPCFGK